MLKTTGIVIRRVNALGQESIGARVPPAVLAGAAVRNAWPAVQLI